MELDFIRKAVQDYEVRKGSKLNPKAVLFDMDGVLYDSMRFHARAWKEVADAHLLISTEEDFYLYEGRPARVRSMNFICVPFSGKLRMKRNRQYTKRNRLCFAITMTENRCRELRMSWKKWQLLDCNAWW